MAAEDMDVLSTEERNNAVLNRWENIFPGSTSNFDIGVSKSWVQDEWSKVGCGRDHKGIDLGLLCDSKR